MSTMNPDEPTAQQRLFDKRCWIEEQLFWSPFRRSNARRSLKHAKNTLDILELVTTRNDGITPNSETLVTPMLDSFDAPIEWLTSGIVRLESNADLDWRVWAHWYNPDDVFVGTFEDMIRHSYDKTTRDPYVSIEIVWNSIGSKTPLLAFDHAPLINQLVISHTEIHRHFGRNTLAPSFHDALHIMDEETTQAGLPEFTRHRPLFSYGPVFTPRKQLDAYADVCQPLIIPPRKRPDS